MGHLHSHDSPKLNNFYYFYKQQPTLRLRKIYTRICTDTLLRTHLDSKGYDTDLSCRICSDSNHNETFSHIFACHEPNRDFTLSAGEIRSVKALIAFENRTLLLPNQRVHLSIRPKIAIYFASYFENVQLGAFPRLKPP